MQQLFEHYRRSGDEARALGVAVILADALPYLENPQSVAGRMLVNRKRPRQALRYLKQAVMLAPDKADNQFVLARAYFDDERNADARLLLERLLRRDPGNTAAQRLLVQIK